MGRGRVFEAGEVVEVRRLPGQKEWERATYVRRIRPDEMPTAWRGPLGHVIELQRARFAGDKRTTCISGQRIRKVTP